MTARLVHGLSLTLVLAALPSYARELTVEDIFLNGRFSGRSLPGLAWTPDGTALTWLEDEGIVKVGERRELLVAKSELGEEFDYDHYELAPNGDFVLFTGSVPSRGLKTGGDFHTFDLATRALTRRTRSPEDQRIIQLSPDGTRVGFVRSNDLYVQDLVTGAETRLTFDGSDLVLNGHLDWVYEEEFGLINGWQWSPDSRRIAFVQVDQSPVPLYPYFIDYSTPHPTFHWMRYPKAGDANSRVRLGVVDVGRGALTWVASSAEYLPRFQWIDFGRLAIQTLNRLQNHLVLQEVDAVTGETRVLREEHTPTYLDVVDDLRFFADGSFLWTSEKDGFRHVYRVARDGTERQLTRGNFETFGVLAVDERANRFFFSANASSLAERQVFAASLDGTGEATQVTEGRGIHNAAFAPTADRFVEFHSHLNQPPRINLRAADGTLERVLEANAIPALDEYELGTWQRTSFTLDDGTEVPGQMLLPNDFVATRKYPVLMYTYGGPQSQVVLDSWQGAKGMWYHLLAQKGYIVAMFDGRGSGGRGKAFASMTYRNLGAYEAADQIAAARHLATLPYVDESRIGIWGWSYGGYMTALTLAKGGDVFRAGIAVAPVSHWAFYDTIYTERFMGLPADNVDGYTQSSPLAHAEGMTGKLLLVHGSGDDNVHLQNSDALATTLLNYGKRFEYVVYPGRTHSIAEGLFDKWHLYSKMTEFVGLNL